MYLLQLKSVVVNKDWTDLARHGNLENWREILAALVTYAGPEDFASLLGRFPWTTATTSTSSLVLQDLAEKVIMLRNAGERERRQFTANTSQILSDKLSQSLPAIKCPSDPYDFRYHGCMDPPMLKSNVLWACLPLVRRPDFMLSSRPHSHLATPITAPVMEIQQPQTPAHPTFSPIVQQRSEPVQSGSSVFKQMLKYQAGLDKLTELALSAIFSEISSFMPAVKILLQLGLT
ncbi:hypothetical protein EMCRGX_G013061 [Ephydatia muelleri]